MVKILDIELFEKDIPSAIEIVLNEHENKNKCISATGAHGLVEARKNEKFKHILNSFFMNLPDGMPGVWVGKLKGAKKMKRCYGPDFFKELMIKSASHNLTHFFCGGKDGVAEKLKIACQKKFNNKNIVGAFCPPFLDVNEFAYKSIAKKINDTQADIIWIGLSTPKQEQFAYKLSKFTKAKFIICVGAAFDFHIGNIRQAPKYLQKLGLEWFFRLMMEPKRLWKRYVEIVPLFIYYNFAELLSGKFYK